MSSTLTVTVWPFLIVLDGFFAGLVPGDVGHMHHAVDIAGQSDEQTELGDVADLARKRIAVYVAVLELLPRIFHALLDAED
jgi:hypothetical protein